MSTTVTQTTESMPAATITAEQPERPQLAKLDATNPTITAEIICDVIRRDGGVIVKNLISSDHAAQIKKELKPYFDTDIIDPTGFFPETTKRASGLIGTSAGCVDYLTKPLVVDVINELLSSKYEFWVGKKRRVVTAKPQISSTAGFRVNPGTRAQGLHRDDA
jgi:CheY-like chemotaxis protein